MPILHRRATSVLLVATMLASCSLFSGDDPKNYALPIQPVGGGAMSSLLGIDPPVGGGGTNGTATFVLDDGRWGHAQLLYVDEPLPDLVTPPTGADLRGKIVEVPVQGENRTFTFVERPPTVVDQIIGCVRVVVNTRDFQPVEQAAVDRFMRDVEAGLTEWMDELPDDPCEGRPDSPPEGATAPPAGTLSGR